MIDVDLETGTKNTLYRTDSVKVKGQPVQREAHLMIDGIYVLYCKKRSS